MQIFYYSFYVSSIILIIYYIHLLLEKNISNNLKIISLFKMAVAVNSIV